ncbi:MAG: helix-turn-helix domain-containing protein [Bacteroidales bacterium]|jgi:transcriptional regulator with XRE-family HTH domain|nr:helix-turn-helix domain-containing protein [Bacteroidales bacterium]
MNKRIELLIKTEGLTNSKFASILGIQRSNITHIIDGRSKPSISFIEKLMTKFPHVNIEWFISGTGEMYKRNKITVEQKTEISPTLFPEVDKKQSPESQKSKIVPQNTERKVKEVENIQPLSAQISKPTEDINARTIQESIPVQKTELKPTTEKVIEKGSIQNTENVNVNIQQSENKPQNLHESEQSNNPPKQSVSHELNPIEKEREIEYVIVFHSDRTFKYYKPV